MVRRVENRRLRPSYCAACALSARTRRSVTDTAPSTVNPQAHLGKPAHHIWSFGEAPAEGFASLHDAESASRTGRLRPIMPNHRRVVAIAAGAPGDLRVVRKAIINEVVDRVRHGLNACATGHGSSNET